MWLARLEHVEGWVQLFESPAGIREFAQISPADEFPVVFGGDVILRSGDPARFRLIVTPVDSASHTRRLEMSRDGGANWSVILDYTYRRVATPAI
ncbi:hypothetical protein MACH05_12700 [Qipengyuania nanhaisediminis]